VLNRQDPDFFREISGSEKSLTDAAAASTLTSEAKILNILEFFGSLESPLQELATVDGTSIWAGDRVHLTSNATRVAATKQMAHIAGGGKTQEPATKRVRLESVIPVRATPPPAGKAAKSAPPPPPTPKPVPHPLWLSGQLPANLRGHNQTARPAAWRARQPQCERRPARTGADCPGQGREQGRAPRRLTRPLGPLVKVH
jgi:hypothetical protein